MYSRLPEFQAPNFQLLPVVAMDSFVIAVIAYIVSMSMAFIFAQKLNYEVNPNQELLAQVLIYQCCILFLKNIYDLYNWFDKVFYNWVL